MARLRPESGGPGGRIVKMAATAPRERAGFEDAARLLDMIETRR
jgi:hypothetical protein